MFTVSNQYHVHCILNNWCICINIRCGKSLSSRATYGAKLGFRVKVQGLGFGIVGRPRESMVGVNMALT